MAASEEDIIRDQSERDNLQRVIASAESAMADSAPGTGARRVLDNLVEQARKRVAVLDKRIEESTRQQATAAVEKVALAVRLAEQEARLSEQEKETYSGFLSKEFFTKKDFGKLEQFYGHTWDRLSEGGKVEMSHRVWEGIRHGEYRFDELPEEVKEKEAKRLYTKLTASSIEQDRLNQIPDVDRTDFIHAYEAGNQKEARQVLNRESFRRNVSLETLVSVKHQAATTGRTADDDGGILADAPSESAATPHETSAMTKVSQAAVALKNVALVDVTSTPTTASLPNASTPNVNGRSPV